MADEVTITTETTQDPALEEAVDTALVEAIQRGETPDAEGVRAQVARERGQEAPQGAQGGDGGQEASQGVEGQESGAGAPQRGADGRFQGQKTEQGAQGGSQGAAAPLDAEGVRTLVGTYKLTQEQAESLPAEVAQSMLERAGEVRADREREFQRGQSRAAEEDDQDQDAEGTEGAAPAEGQASEEVLPEGVPSLDEVISPFEDLLGEDGAAAIRLLDQRLQALMQGTVDRVAALEGVQQENLERIVMGEIHEARQSLVSAIPALADAAWFDTKVFPMMQMLGKSGEFDNDPTPERCIRAAVAAVGAEVPSPEAGDPSPSPSANRSPRVHSPLQSRAPRVSYADIPQDDLEVTLVEAMKRGDDATIQRIKVELAKRT